MKPHIFAVTALGRDKVASLTLGGLYPQESPGTQFTGGSVDPRTCLDTSEQKSPTSDTRDRTQVLAKRIVA